jgi:aspartyl-tRNA(Asn)/glutamyl-tRNA(Gln) amidotransferase subunit C
MTRHIGLDELRRIASLARLALEDAELRMMHAQIDSILDSMATLNRLDTTDVPPTYHAVEMVCPLRDDVPQPPLHREEVLRAAPRTEAGAFAVPQVMEGE